MSYVGDTGQGATVVFAPTTSIEVGCIRSCDLPEWSMEKVDATCLETTDFGRWVAGDLTDPGELTLVAVFAATDQIFPTSGTLGQTVTATVTFPIGDPANSSPATLTGSGFISRRKLPNLATNELMEVELTFAFDGNSASPPTFTPEAA